MAKSQSAEKPTVGDHAVGKTTRRPGGVKDVTTSPLADKTKAATAKVQGKKAADQAPIRTNEPSIRQTILAGLAKGLPNDEIAQQLKELFPASKAAEKPSKHIAFYKAQLKKAAKVQAQAD